MQAIHGVTVVYARNSFIAFIAALLAILRVSERPDATGSKKPSCSFFHRPSPTKHVILSDSNTERRSYTPATCHIHSKLPFFRIFGLDAYVLIISVYGRFAQPIKILHIVQHSHQENCTICDFSS